MALVELYEMSKPVRSLLH